MYYIRSKEWRPGSQLNELVSLVPAKHESDGTSCIFYCKYDKDLAVVSCAAYRSEGLLDCRKEALELEI